MPTSFHPLRAALSVRSSGSPSRSSSAAPLRALLPGGVEPCLVIDAAGRIVAVNEGAARMLGRSQDDLIGDFFGVWGPERDSADLDLIRVRDGLAEAACVRARRVASREAGNTSIVFENLHAFSLAEAIGLTALEVTHADGAANLQVSFLQLPHDVRVSAEFRSAMRLWLEFFRNVADGGQAALQIQVWKNEAEAGWLDIEICLNQPHPPPLRVGAYESTDLEEASAAVEHLGGVFQLRVDFPEVSALLHLPVA